MANGNGDGRDPQFVDGVNPTHFYRYNNLPIRGSPWIHRDAMPHQDLQLSENHRADTFKLWDEEDMERYRDLLSKVGELIDIVEERFQVVKEHKNWVVFVRWVEPSWAAAKNPPISREDDDGDNNSRSTIYR